MCRPWSHLVCAAWCVCALAGCKSALLSDEGATWPATAEDRPETRGAEHRPEPKTIPLEIVFAGTDDHDTTWQEELWDLADEQAFDTALRRRLAANGLRVGLLSAPLPPRLASRLEPAAATAQPDELPSSPVERPAVTRRFLRLLPGRDNEVVAATGFDELILFEHDGAEVHGSTFHDATTYFALKAWPAADGRVRIEITPTVKHGPLERSWVGEEGAFRLDTGQKRRPLERLGIATTVPQGGTLLVGAVGEASSTVGDAFFGEHANAGCPRRLLAVRSQGRPIDPLFTAADEKPAANPAN